MHRRTLLSGLALGAGIAGAGCLAEPGDGEDDGTPTETPTETPTGTPPADDGNGRGGRPDFDPAGREPAWTTTVGDRDAVAFPDNALPIEARVWNDGPDRAFRVVVDRGDDRVVDEDITLAGDEYLTVTLTEPGAYALALGLDGGSLETVVSYHHGQFDCNTTTTTVQVTDTGAIRSETISTEIACPPTELVETTFEPAAEGTCGSQQSAQIAIDGTSVVVDGRVVTPVPCYDIALEDATYDPETDRLTVDVTPDERHDGVCVECVGEVAYEARLEFAHAHPGSIRVRHRHGDELVTVATTTLS